MTLRRKWTPNGRKWRISPRQQWLPQARGLVSSSRNNKMKGKSLLNHFLLLIFPLVYESVRIECFRKLILHTVELFNTKSPNKKYCLTRAFQCTSCRCCQQSQTHLTRICELVTMHPGILVSQFPQYLVISTHSFVVYSMCYSWSILVSGKRLWTSSCPRQLRSSRSGRVRARG